MKNRVHILVALALTLLSGSSAFADDIELSQVPDVVKDAAAEALPGIVLVEAELEQTADGPVYELEGTVDDRRYELELTEVGVVLQIELEDSEEVTLSDIPQPARDAVLAAVPGIELLEAEAVRGEQDLYEIEGKLNGKKHEILVTGDGDVLEVDGDSDDDSEADSDDDSDDTDNP